MAWCGAVRLSGWSLPVEYLSATSVSRFVQCPEAWRQKYLLRQPERLYPDRFLGLVDHSAWAYAFNYQISHGTPLELDWLRGIYRARWQALQDEDEVDWQDQDEDKLRDLGLLMMETYHTVVAPTVIPTGVELRFEEKIKGVPVPVVGYIDIETADTIIDRKTSAQRVSKPKPAWRFQARLYQLFVPKDFDWHVITKQKTPQVCVPSEYEPQLRLPHSLPASDQTVNMLLNVSHEMQDLYARHGKDEVWPARGMFHEWACSYCSWGPRYKNSCYAWGTDAAT